MCELGQLPLSRKRDGMQTRHVQEQTHQNQVTGWSWRMREEEYRMTWLTLSDRVNNATENVCVEQAASEEEHL